VQTFSARPWGVEMDSEQQVTLPPGAAEMETEYRFLHELGRGGTAIVYLAEDLELRRKVAIKLIQSPLATDEESLQRFTREARTAALLHHSNIVAVHSVKRLRGDVLAMVMQYVPDGTLKDLIQRAAPLPIEIVEDVLRDVGVALQFAHGRGIIHRDVKPENIFLDEANGTALLADFGIARNAEVGPGPTLAGVVLGTPAYMAPEQIDGLPVDGRADLYSLGVVAWEMLTGRAPWEGESLYSIIYNQKHRALPSLRAIRSDVPPNLLSTIETALQKDPDRRFPDAQAFLDSLNDASGSGFWSGLWARFAPRHGGRSVAPVLPTPGRIEVPADRVESSAGSEPAASERTDNATIRWNRAEAAAALAGGAAGGGEAGAENREGATAIVAGALASGALGAPRSKPLWHGGAMARRPARLAAAVGGLLLLPGIGLAAMYGIQHYFPTADDDPAAAFDRSIPRSGATGFGATIDSGTDAVLAADSLPWPLGSEPNALPSIAYGASEYDRLYPPVETPMPRTIVRIDTVRVYEAPRAGASDASGGSSGSSSSASSRDDGSSGSEAAATVRIGSVAVAAGGMHTCALLGTGEVLCWGGNNAGQLGVGRSGRVATPTRIEGIRFRDIAAGVSHTCGVTTAGEAVCWGNNQHGELGDGTATARRAPVQVQVGGSHRFARVRTGGSHTCGLTDQGEVFCWGDNRLGQLGDNSNAARRTPARAGSGGFASVDAGWNHSCALDRSGQAHCWGSNEDGQLGIGSTENAAAPSPVVSRQRFTQLVTGGSHTCAVTSGGDAFCWGRNQHGQLGDGATSPQSTPAAVTGGLSFASLAAGSVHTCGLTRNGEAYCWGQNSYGQLGDGSTADRRAPVRVEGFLRFASLHASGAHTCGVTPGGQQYCWGYNVEGQIGDGSRSHRTRPVRVELPSN
jgi:serine/threonine protein kinase/alpha-tubulin suppressor-like RCC1 family protein